MPPSSLTLLDRDIEHYLLELTPQRDPALAEMEEYAAGRKFPIVGPLVGRLLFQLARLTQAKRILELGSGFGYSAYWFAKATSPLTRIICTDGKQENADLAAAWFRQGQVDKKIDFRVGDALRIIENLDGGFDIIFTDIEKEHYPQALAKSLPLLRAGGLFIADNVLWSGRVLDSEPDESTSGILTMNRLLYSSPQLFTTIIPLRDGVSVSIKL